MESPVGSKVPSCGTPEFKVAELSVHTLTLDG